ncbi:winged helix-turn-helix domain-containing protein [Actinoplanes sp. NPDC023714]|uniref:AfsR/SARP family transcriptional regulator n=1 Tax=Actinoplanes sp. NPDC023714 TaxID=3154322 RepID=UPI00340E158A
MTDGPSAVTLRFEILGPVRAFRGAEQVDIGPVRQRAVLALLLLNAGTPVPLEEIVTALWNGDPPENGVDIVQRYVGNLRRALDPDRTALIAYTEGGYVLRPSESDAGEFRAALTRAHTEHRTGNLDEATSQVSRALDLWRSEPLTGLTGPVFESARARLNLERATAAKLMSRPAQARPDQEPPPTRLMEPEPTGDPYPEAVDPWHGHDLFPPDPLTGR